MKKAIVLLGLTFLGLGCGHFRFVATSETRPIWGVQTKDRYRLFQFCVKQDGQYVNLDDQAYASAWATFKSTVPNVFADEGKPIAVYLDYTDGSDSKYGWTLVFPYILSCCTLPFWNHDEWRSHYSIRFKKPKKVSGELRNGFSVKMERDWNMSFYTPSALLFPYSTPVAGDQGQPFYQKQCHVMGSTDQTRRAWAVNAAIAYGAACALRHLEDDGSMPEVWEDGDDASKPDAAVEPPNAPEAPQGEPIGEGMVEFDSIPL